MFILNRLYGADYVSWFKNQYGVEPKYVPHPNPNQIVDTTTGEVTGPDVLFARNFSVDSERLPVTAALGMVKVGDFDNVEQACNHYAQQEYQAD